VGGSCGTLPAMMAAPHDAERTRLDEDVQRRRNWKRWVPKLKKAATILKASRGTG
jgi:hypothetical protein